MKALNNILLLIILFVLIFTSCIDKDYDWDNVDKTAVITVGNVPIGDAKKLTIKSLLPDDLEADLKVSADGVLYLEYYGNIEIEDPDAQMPETDPVLIETITHTLSAASVPLPLNETIKVVDNDPVSYTIDEPFYDDEDWEIMVTAVDFATCDFVAEIVFTGVEFSDTGSTEGRVELDVEFPDNIKLVGNNTNKANVSAKLKDLENGRITLPGIVLQSIDYQDGVQDLVYSITIYGGDNTQLTAQAGKFDFDLTFFTRNVTPDIVYGNASFNQKTYGVIDDLRELENSFSAEDVMEFSNIQLYLNLNTNLGADFTIGVDRISTQNSWGEERSLLNATGDKLLFNKPEIGKTRATSYVIANINPGAEATFVQADLASIFTIIPSYLDCEFSIHNDNISDKSVFFLYDRLIIDADYKVVVPFSFSRLDLHLADTLTNVFKDDLAEKIFFQAGELKVSGTASVNFKNAETGVFKLRSKVSILDSNMDKIDLNIMPSELTNGQQTLNITIHIKESDINRLQTAMHMSFDFEIINDSGQTLSLYEDDFIEITGIAFQSTSGFKFDLD